jgi:hypothetical protein
VITGRQNRPGYILANMALAPADLLQGGHSGPLEPPLPSSRWPRSQLLQPSINTGHWPPLWCGHLDIYSHVSEGLHGAAADRIAGIIFGTS